MTIMLNLDPEVERDLLAKAHRRGVSLDEYVQEIVTRETGSPSATPSPAGATLHTKVDNLSDLLLNSPFAGANLNLERSQDYPRLTEIE